MNYYYYLNLRYISINYNLSIRSLNNIFAYLLPQKKQRCKYSEVTYLFHDCDLLIV